MASIRQRNGRWQARITRKGFPTEVRSFDTKGAALQWARSIESSVDKGTHTPSNTSNELLFWEVLERYRLTVSPLKRSHADENIKIRALQRDRIASYSMANLTAEVLADYRDRRLRTVTPGTLVRDLAAISSIINHARKEWRIRINNPCALIRKPQLPPGRDRRLNEKELDAMLEALRPVGRRSPWMHPLVQLALETAMRRGELLSLTWDNIDLTARTAFLPMTKNGTARTVPLSTKAVEILASLPRTESAKVFPVTYMVLEQAFKRARLRAGITNFHFHDLRHMATTRLAAKLPNVLELAAVTGHQTVQMLKRYYHPTASELARKLG